MKFDFKKMYVSIICTVVGLLGFIFLSFNCISVFYDFGKQSKAVSFNGYEAMGNSISEALNKIYDNFNIDTTEPFLLNVISIFQIGILAVTIILVIVGALGFIKEYVKHDLIDRLNADKIKEYQRHLLVNYCKLQIISAIFYLLACLLASYKGSVMGISITLGMKPSFGLFFIGISSFVILRIFNHIEKKYVAAPKNPHTEDTDENI